MAYKDVKVPAGGAAISIKDGKLQVPANPIVPFVEGDGTGRADPCALRTAAAKVAVN